DLITPVVIFFHSHPPLRHPLAFTFYIFPGHPAFRRPWTLGQRMIAIVFPIAMWYSDLDSFEPAFALDVQLANGKAGKAVHSVSASGIWTRFRNRFIGDRAFYKMALSLVVPVIIQNTVTSFVNLLDNVMVGNLGTAHLSGVAIANHLMFVFNLTI